MSIYKYSDINLKKINYNKPEINGSFYYSSINYDNTPLHIQSPRMKCKLSGGDILQKGFIECEPLNTDFSFYDFFLNIEDRNIKETFKKNEEWFGKDIPLEMIDDMYKRTIKAVKKDSKPNFTFKIPVSRGKVQCQIYNNNNICVDINKLNPESEIILILHIRGLKFLKQHYYCDCYVSQLKVYLSKEESFNIFNHCVIDDEKSDDDIDIIDEEILEDIHKKEIQEKQRTEKKLVLEKQISELKEQLDNL